MKDDKPLVSYLLLTYNQEKYIKEAVESALAQTYSPLEIIISDDCSKDKTFEIIKETVTEYKGPHKIILNRNEQNLGIAGNVNKVMAMAKGELFVMAAGDDISLPHRTQVLYDYWQKYKNQVYAFTSSMKGIDTNGLPYQKSDRFFNGEPQHLEIEDYFKKCHWCGAGSAYDRYLFDLYGPINYDFNEDRAYLTRCWLIGKTLALKEVLLKYRWGGISTKPTDTIYKLNSRWNLNCYLQLNKDLKKINKKISKKTEIYIQNQILKYRYLYNYYKTESFFKKLLYYKNVIKIDYQEWNKYCFLPKNLRYNAYKYYRISIIIIRHLLRNLNIEKLAS